MLRSYLQLISQVVFYEGRTVIKQVTEGRKEAGVRYIGAALSNHWALCSEHTSSSDSWNER